MPGKVRPPERVLRKVLVANRGEIAVRILRACGEMNIATVAVYSDADRTAPHVYHADEAVALGPPPAAESYLRVDRILEAAQRTGADAIHPGYGFLSENPEFAGAVRDAGLIFIGPPAAAMRTMGSKTAARAAMQAAGVPVVPGYQESQDEADLATAAERVGYPLLVKATAGGGGKGMRLVTKPAALPEALESARREASSAFGDDRIYLEKAIRNPRHVEIQILGDEYGQILHLFERECSVQRRHQKIVEEAPSPLLSDDLRRRMGEAAVRAAQAVAYTNAGTVEFLVDEGGNFYFLEMNTRLQVEHPVTELVTGIDLVQWQVRVARGERLPWQQADLSLRGHAIECRIYAEDPTSDFLPATGTILRWQEPGGPGVRVDSGVAEGNEITRFYDPLLAKLIVHSEDRAQALARMERALGEFVVLGDLRTNVDFLRAAIAHPIFQRGEATTDFIARHMDSWQRSASVPDEALIAAAVAVHLERAASVPVDAVDGDPHNPWQRLHGFRVS